MHFPAVDVNTLKRRSAIRTATVRRAEAAARIEHFDPDTGGLRVIGKGNKERMVYATEGGRAALDAWLAVRGTGPGPLLAPVSKAGIVHAGAGITPHALMMRLKHRSALAAIRTCSPHDLRRTIARSAPASRADLAMVQALAGHASPTTTARYDRRPEAAKREAARLVHVPYIGNAP